MVRKIPGHQAGEIPDARKPELVRYRWYIVDVAGIGREPGAKTGWWELDNCVNF